jgi:hypothetical protein
MARVIALMALAALGLTEAPVHDHHSERLMSTTERYHALREIRLDGRACRSRLRLVARAVIIRHRAWRGLAVFPGSAAACGPAFRHLPGSGAASSRRSLLWPKYQRVP